ncbi:choice-of-anchor D domain-containing protein [Telmatobacter sp. DSM 110680]|uniref:Choice-of-anchor D domain-containing protein n=1 Tax=Telmatobacter sp. DSM 110680 TaxID=3036704 RepID=A0AAU7DF68_9BACT
MTSGVLQRAFPNAVTGISGYVLKLNAAGSALVFSTYLPGTDAVEGLALDTSNNVYTSGMTQETNLPAQSNAFQPTFGSIATCDCWDGFIFKLNNNGTQALAATYFNGITTSSTGYYGASTVLRDIRVDSIGNVAVGGITGAANLPLKNPLVSVYNSMGLPAINSSLMLARFTGDLSSLQFSSYLGAIDSSASFNALTVDPDDRLLIAGGIQSKLFPTTPGVYQPVAPSPQTAYTVLNYQFIANIDVSVPAPSLCFDSTTLAFGTIPVGTSSQASLNLTNCGNAALTLSSVQSSSSLYTATNNCSAIAPGSACKVQVTYTPTAVGETDGTLTIAGNMAISPQVASFTGAGGVPSVYFPSSITFSDLLVGETGSLGVLAVTNSGSAPFVLSSATVTGDFQITQNTCTSPVPARGNCQITMNFSPTGAGTRIGSLILQDNLTPPTQAIQLTGNGLTTAPVPVITAIPAIAQITSGVGQVGIIGTGFFPNSVVYWNGVAKTTYYGSEGYLAAQLTAADLAQIGESSVTVRTPAPGGGTSNAFQAVVYGRMQNLQVLHTVYDPATSQLYASISSTSSQNANSVVIIDPVAMQITGTLLTGGKPDVLALSDDGTLLYVGQDDLQSVSQIALPSGKVNFTVQLPPTSDTFLSSYGIEASALAVVPGKPHTWIVGLCYINVSPCGGGAVIYDDSTMRPVVAEGTQLTANSFAFVNDPGTIFSTEFNQSPPDVSSYSISSTGITHTAVSSFGASAGGATLASDGTLLYVANGQVIDPATLTVKYTYPQGSGGGFALDRANSRIFFGGSSYSQYYGALKLTVVDLASKSTIGSISFQEYGYTIDVQRFGVKGVVINQGNELIFVQTSLTNSSTTPPTVTVTPSSLSFGSLTKGTRSAASTVTLKNSSSVPLNISSISAYAGDFTMSTDFAQTNNCPTALAAGSSCAIGVTFTPSTTAYETGQLTIYDDAPSGNQIVPLDGTGVAAATTYSATATPANLTFASQSVGIASGSQAVTLTNTGTGALTISRIAATGDFAETNNCGSSLPSGSSCAVTVTFTPTATGNRTGQLTISDNATAGSQTVSLSGTGAASAYTYSASVTPASLTFAAQGLQITSAAQTVTLTNTGTGALTISSITAQGDFAETNNCGASIAAGAACSVNVTFTPTASGSRGGQLTISDNATAGPQTVALSGAGTSPISVAPSATGGNSASVAAGSTATYNLVLSSNGYAGTVTLACAGAPAYATCTPSPASTSITAGQTATVKVTVTTATTSQSSLLLPGRGRSERSGAVVAGIGWFLIPALPLLWITRRRAMRAGLLVALGAAMIASLAGGCGSGGGSTSNPPPTTHDTAPGTYTLTVTATAGAASSTEQLTLVVQ